MCTTQWAVCLVLALAAGCSLGCKSEPPKTTEAPQPPEPPEPKCGDKPPGEGYTCEVTRWYVVITEGEKTEIFTCAKDADCAKACVEIFQDTKRMVTIEAKPYPQCEEAVCFCSYWNPPAGVYPGRPEKKCMATECRSSLGCKVDCQVKFRNVKDREVVEAACVGIERCCCYLKVKKAEGRRQWDTVN